MKPAGKETDPLAGTPVPDIARETQRARSLALVVLIASTISLIADTLLATLVGGPWGAGGVIGALGASIVLCFRSSRDGNIVYSFFLLAMLCAIIFQCFQLYATVHFWQLWVRAAPLHTEHTTLRRLTDASQAPELTGCARSPQTTGSKPPAALQPHRAPGTLQRNEFNEATSSEASQAIAEIAAEHDEIVYTVVSYTSIASSCICLAVEPWAILRGARAHSAIIREMDASQVPSHWAH